MNTDILQNAANQARGLAIDAVHACSSGHLGLPLGCAEIGSVLFSESLVFNPKAPKWLNRDRFILSAGHGSMFIYSWLHLAGYKVSLQDLKDFRKFESITPGHPEFNETEGVEATTGPLGQGVANAVGYAVSGKRAASYYNTTDHQIFDHHVVALMGDGCFQEGVAREAIEYAGHVQLDNLILIYDSNDVTLDAMADVSQGVDSAAFFASQGWDAVTIDGHNFSEISEAVANAKANNNGKPKVIIAKTEIARGIPQVAGTAKGHGEGGAAFADEAKGNLGLELGGFYVTDEVRSYYADAVAKKEETFKQWEETFKAWSTANPELAKELKNETPADLSAQIPEFGADHADATRGAGGAVVQSIAKAIPQFITGSADLYGSNKNYIKGEGDFVRGDHSGRNLWYGIREHAMGAISNGIAYDGIFRPSCATFLVFADYLRPSIRLAGLAHLPVTYIFTHDSVGVGEDGPTHQPVETVSGLRVIPNLDVIRPADGEETAGAWIAAQERSDGPTALILTRQKVRTNNEVTAAGRREGVAKGGYILKKETGALKVILMATGSEVGHCMEAAEQLGEGVRVVSMPCLERFDRQDEAYRNTVLPEEVTARVAIEAGVSGLWWKYVGTKGRVLGIDRFGISAPGDLVMNELGMNASSVVSAVKEIV